MPGNHTGFLVGWLAGTYPGRLGWMFNSVADIHRNPDPFMPYAVDNGVFAAWRDKRQWQETQFYDYLSKLRLYSLKPLWVVVPDSVGDREDTLRKWFLHSPRISAMGFRLALAVQDGMTPDDVPPNCDMIFVGGTDYWKMPSLSMLTRAFQNVHVGRINTESALWGCHDLGVKSCDGTGWFRGDKKQLAGLFRYLKESTIGYRDQRELDLLHVKHY